MGQLVGSEELVQISLKVCSFSWAATVNEHPLTGLQMKQERAQELWQHVKDLQKDM
jgi:hypothetical protein